MPLPCVIPGRAVEVASAIVGSSGIETLRFALATATPTIIGAELAARAAPDGYTIFMGINGTMAINPSMYKKLTPKDIIARLSSEVNKVRARKDVQQQLVALGYETMTGTPGELAALLKQDIGRWAGVIRSAGITPE